MYKALQEVGGGDGDEVRQVAWRPTYNDKQEMKLWSKHIIKWVVEMVRDASRAPHLRERRPA